MDPEMRFKQHSMEGIPAADLASKCNLATTDVVIVVSIGELLYMTLTWKLSGRSSWDPSYNNNNPWSYQLHPNTSFFPNV